ncbi:MAG: hypothetical protein WCR19_06140 [Acholeplasmataceae bacterium]
MADFISEKKWIYLGFGLFNIVFLFLPVAIGETYNYYIFSLFGLWGTLLLLALLYFLVIVPFNAIFQKAYSSDYYDTVIKVMNFIIPILGLIALVRYRHLAGLLDSESFTWVYYAWFGLIFIEHGYNIRLTLQYL